METFYFMGIALGGGLLASFLSAGWSSFKHKKLPEKGILFRSFVAGLVTAGLLAYAWIFGSGGDMGDVVNRIGDALDLQNVMKLTTVAGALNFVGSSGSSGTDEKAQDLQKEELQIGMPKF
jgi:hypothetical protein